MIRRVVCVVSALAAVAAAAACSFERSSDPLTPTVAGPIPGVVITSPKIMQPVNGARLRSDQELTFIVTSVTTNGVRPLSYAIEIASDVVFNNVVLAKGGFTPGSGPQTTFTLADKLPSDTSYFWRARAEDGANASAFSDAAQFSLYTPVYYEAPGPLAPINNTTVSNLRPQFQWRNAPRSGGTPDLVRYLIELSDTDTFTQKASAEVPEDGSGRTFVSAPQDLPLDKQLFWHVRPFDSDNVGPWSATQVFRTPKQGSGTGGCSFPGPPANATVDEWKACFFSLVEKRGVGPTVTIQGIWTLRPELNAMGAEWQNGWRGDPRPRLFLPVPNCPSATNPSPPACAYSRTVDVGDWGGLWQWVYRGQT